MEKALWYLLAGTRGGANRARIIRLLDDRPRNANQLAEALEVDYNTIRHHLDVLLDHDVVETLRGDMTEAETVDRLRETVGDAGADAVVSDMAPNMTGEYSVDHARSIHLARQALGVAEDVLAPGGDLVVKAFDGPDLAALRTDMDDTFEYVRSIRPDASRDSSSEVYLVAKGYLTAPIAAGDELVVDVVDRGDEGDGIARVDGFTVFVPDAEVGDRVDVRIDEVKPRFAFAERV